MGIVGWLRDCNVISTMDDFVYYEDIVKKTTIDAQYVIKDVVKKVFNELRNNKRLEIQNGIEHSLSMFIFATKDKIFTIDTDGGVTEYDDYAVIGCRDDAVNGFLGCTYMKDLSEEMAKELIKKSIQKACKKRYIHKRANRLCILEGMVNIEFGNEAYRI